MLRRKALIAAMAMGVAGLASIGCEEKPAAPKAAPKGNPPAAPSGASGATTPAAPK